EIMRGIGPKKVVHGGTYASNPISLAAADATLDLIATGKVHQRINTFGSRLMKGIRDALEDREIDAVVQGYPGMFQFLFTKLEKVTSFRDLQFCDFEAFGALQLELLKHGVMLDEDNGEPVFTCYAHSDEDLEKTLEAVDSALPHAFEGKRPIERENRFSS
ncbi:MAG: aminotransferase class III-fold pyridoxal phosphate-dependent enzyme, partial [Thaumarchaeota archaeon]|nr:aminotransferase class III-fold pyridoxal phosphate-dependent enzyme [Nitrososphaerota archaeon]